MTPAEGAPPTEIEEELELESEGPIPYADLHALMRQSRRTHDASLRRLVVGYLTLRRVTADLVALVGAREGGATIASTPLYRRARDLATTPPR